jgi:hypothetical protein
MKKKTLYSIKKILSDKDIEDLIKLHDKYSVLGRNRYKTNERVQYNNLNDVIYTDITDVAHTIPALKKLDVKGHKRLRTYFVKYFEGSYAVPHKDVGHHDKGTTRLTVIDTSKDLKGGHPVYYKRGKGEHKRNMYPIVEYNRKGFTTTHKFSLMHGVSKVKKGWRLVLVTWYREKNESTRTVKRIKKTT